LLCKAFRCVGASIYVSDMRSLHYDFNGKRDGSGEPACPADVARAGPFDRRVGGSAGGSRRHAIRIAAFNTATILARAIRVHTSYARANHEAHALIRQALTGSGDIDPSDGVLTVRLDPLPTRRAITAIAQLCEHLTATKTRYPGTDLILR
jgi:hypothetical protein